MSKFGESILRGCADLATRRPWLVIARRAAADGARRLCASPRLTVDTSTEDILSSDLPFRQVEIAYERVSRGGPRSRRHRRSDRRRRRKPRRASSPPALRPHRSFSNGSSVAGSSPYFDRYGLLFLTPEEITAIGERAPAGAAAC